MPGHGEPLHRLSKNLTFKRASALLALRRFVRGPSRQKKWRGGSVSRFLVEIHAPMVTTVIVVADSAEDAKNRAMGGEGAPQEQWPGDPTVAAVRELES